MPGSAHPATGTNALETGLAVLRLLAEAQAPVTATAIAARLGVHVSTASRILGALTAQGYVRKPDYRSFALDVGVVTLGAHAAAHVPAVGLTREPLVRMAEQAPWAALHLGRLHHDQLIYLHLHCRVDGLPTTLQAGRYPLHLSAIALRLLLDAPRETALAALAASRRRYGWERPTPAVPTDEATTLARAAALDRDGCLVLADWQRASHLVASIAVAGGGHGPLALAVTAPDPARAADAIALLHAGAARLEAALRADASAPDHLQDVPA